MEGQLREKSPGRALDKILARPPSPTSGSGTKPLATLFAHLDPALKKNKKGWAAKKPAKPNSQSEGTTLDVFGASGSGQLNLLQEVLAAGQPIDALDAQRRSPLHYAVAALLNSIENVIFTLF